MDWTGGLDWWTGLVDWWTGLVDWTGGLDCTVDWTGGLDWWTGPLYCAMNLVCMPGESVFTGLDWTLTSYILTT